MPRPCLRLSLCPPGLGLVVLWSVPERPFLPAIPMFLAARGLLGPPGVMFEHPGASAMKGVACPGYLAMTGDVEDPGALAPDIQG